MSELTQARIGALIALGSVIWLAYGYAEKRYKQGKNDALAAIHESEEKIDENFENL